MEAVTLVLHAQFFTCQGLRVPAEIAIAKIDRVKNQVINYIFDVDLSQLHFFMKDIWLNLSKSEHEHGLLFPQKMPPVGVLFKDVPILVRRLCGNGVVGCIGAVQYQYCKEALGLPHVMDLSADITPEDCFSFPHMTGHDHAHRTDTPFIRCAFSVTGGAAARIVRKTYKGPDILQVIKPCRVLLEDCMKSSKNKKVL